jgi:hypothetical protein
MVPALHNFITVDTAGFLSNPQNVQAVYNMCEKILQEDSGDDPQCHACKILEVILLQCQGHVDDVAHQSFDYYHVMQLYICLCVCPGPTTNNKSCFGACN